MTVIARQAVLFFLFVILLAGCAVHKPQSIELPAPLPGSFSEKKEAAVTRGTPIDRWWKAFGDEKLNILMEETFAGNLDLAQAFARLDQLLAITGINAASGRPFLDLGGQASRGSRPGFFGDDTGSNYSLSLTVGYEMDLWKKLDSRTKAATLEAEASREDILALYLTLSAQLADLYYLAVEQRSQLQLMDNTIRSFTEIYELVKRLYIEGLVSALDLYQARQNLASSKARRPVFEANLTLAENALSIILGRYPDRKSAGKLNMLPKPPAPIPPNFPSEVLARRTDIRAALLRLKASDSSVAAAIADRFPSFNLLGSTGRSRTAFSTGAFSGMFWNLLVNFAQPVLDGGKRKAEVERNRALFRENLAIYHKTVLTAFQEVEDALVKNRTTQERIARLEEQVQSTEAGLRISIDRYIQGLSDYLPVLTAQALHFDGQSQLLAARRQLISDRISMAKAIGGDWMGKEMEKFHEKGKNDAPIQ